MLRGPNRAAAGGVSAPRPGAGRRCMVHDRNPLYHSRYRRSNAYDPQWVFANLMGPHPLWLVEALVESLPIEPGMRVLDLGCGTALTSIFLAKEFGARVWATDL